MGFLSEKNYFIVKELQILDTAKLAFVLEGTYAKPSHPFSGFKYQMIMSERSGVLGLVLSRKDVTIRELQFFCRIRTPAQMDKILEVMNDALQIEKDWLNIYTMPEGFIECADTVFPDPEEAKQKAIEISKVYTRTAPTLYQRLKGERSWAERSRLLSRSSREDITAEELENVLRGWLENESVEHRSVLYESLKDYASMRASTAENVDRYIINSDPYASDI